MPDFIYRLGARGPEVERLQRRLQQLGLYGGLLDGHFGGGTESAVRLFQQREGLLVDGLVGPDTWRRLFPDAPEVPAPAVAGKPLGARCLELTGAFETSAAPPYCYAAVSGDFDGQGLSYGALQWNFGQGSLPPLFHRLDALHPGVLDEVFHVHAATLRDVLGRPRTAQVEWARAIQSPALRVHEPWRGLFRALGLREAFQEVQIEFAAATFDAALDLCRTYGLQTERAAALMFDIKTQNGSIGPRTRRRILDDFATRPPSDDPADEVDRLVIVANRRADAASRRWREDVRRRKLTIALGEGVVHGERYHLSRQYDLDLRVVPALAPVYA